MKHEMLREYPQLPVLTLPQAVKVFKAANLGPSAIAELTGMSRVAVSGWFNNKQKPPRGTTQQAVSVLAYKVLRALQHKHYPMKRQRSLTPAAFDALYDRSYTTPLADTPIEDLLPKAWLEKFNQTREADALPTP